MDLPVRIKPLRRSDVSACIAIVVADPFFQSYGVRADPLQKSLRSALVPSRASATRLYGAFQGKTLVGFAWFAMRGGLDRLPYLRMIAVRTNLQGHGIGRKLLDHFTKKHGRGLMLLVTTSNRAALGFYRSLGFIRVGVFKSFVRPSKHETLFWRPH